MAQELKRKVSLSTHLSDVTLISWALFLWTICYAPMTLSRWLKPDEANTVFKTFYQNYHIKKDARAEYTVEYNLAIQFEGGRNEGTQVFSIDPDVGKYTVEEAYTINGDKKIQVEPSQIMVSQNQLAQNGILNETQTTVIFPDVRVGSIIHLKVRAEVFKFGYKNQVSFVVNPASYTPVEDYRFSLISDVPLAFELNDPRQLLTSGMQTQSLPYTWTLKSTQPLSNQIIDENNSLINQDRLTLIYFSTSRSHQDYFKEALSNFEKVINQETPRGLKDIIASAKTLPRGENQIRFAINELKKRVRYQLDHRLSGSQIVPHDLETIDKAGYGDCKDISVMLIHLFRKLGYPDAHPALIEMSMEPTRWPASLIVDTFNHVIVRLKYKENIEKTFWIDGTDNVTYIDGVRPQIANRPSLVFLSDHIEEVRTPELDETSAVIELSKTKKLINDHWDLKFNLKLFGLDAARYTGLDLFQSQELTKKNITQYFITLDKSDFNYEPFDLKDLNVRPLEFSGRGTVSYSPQLTTLGTAMTLNDTPILDQMAQLDLTQRESHFRLNDPSTLRQRIHFPNLKLKGSKDRVECHLKSPWIDFHIGALDRGTLTLINDTFIKKSKITLDEMKTPEFKVFLKKAKQCAQKRLVVYKKL